MINVSIIHLQLLIKKLVPSDFLISHKPLLMTFKSKSTILNETLSSFGKIYR